MWKLIFLYVGMAVANNPTGTYVIYETCNEFVEAAKAFQEIYGISGENCSIGDLITNISASDNTIPVPGICSQQLLPVLGEACSNFQSPSLVRASATDINGIDVAICIPDETRVRRSEDMGDAIEIWFQAAVMMGYRKLEALCDIGPTAHLNLFTVLHNSECFSGNSSDEVNLTDWSSDLPAPMMKFSDVLDADSNITTTCGSTYSPPDDSSSSLGLILGLTFGGLAIVGIAAYVYIRRNKPTLYSRLLSGLV